MVLPLPVPPMTAVVSPGRATRSTAAQHGCLGARIAEVDIAQLQGPVSSTVVTGLAGGTTLDSVSSTSSIRSAQTSARGIMTNMKVAIMTAIRICIR